MPTIDGTGLAKTGRGSIGVARPYKGRLGKVVVCQVAVCLTPVAGDVAIPVCIRLLMPEEWECDPERRRAAGVPEDLRHDMGRPAMALEMVRHLRGLGAGSTASAATASMGTAPIRSRALSRTGSSMFLTPTQI